MVKIIFETHASSLDNEARQRGGVASGHYDVALSPAGEEQARELGRRHRGRSIEQSVGSGLSLRKRYYVSDRAGVRQDGHQPVKVILRCGPGGPSVAGRQR